MAKKKKRKVYLISMIVSFILSVLLSVGGYLVGAALGIFNSDTLFSSMSAAGYYNGIYNEIKTTSVQLGKPMMLPAEVFENVFYYDEVKDDIKKSLSAQISGTMYTPDTTQLKDRLNNNIEQFANERDIEIGNEQKTAIEGFVKQIDSNYKSSLGIKFINYYVSIKKMFDSLFLKLMAVILLLIMLAVFIIIKDNRYIHRAFRYLAYSTLASAIMTGFIPLIVYLKGAYRKLAISPAYYYNTLVKTADRSLIMILCVSLFFILLSIVLILLVTILKKKVIEKDSHRHHHHSSEFN